MVALASDNTPRRLTSCLRGRAKSVLVVLLRYGVRLCGVSWKTRRNRCLPNGSKHLDFGAGEQKANMLFYHLWSSEGAQLR